MTIPTILACHAQTLQPPHSALADSCLLCKGACDRGVWSCTRLVHSGIPLAAHVSPPTHGRRQVYWLRPRAAPTRASCSAHRHDHDLVAWQRGALPLGCCLAGFCAMALFNDIATMPVSSTVIGICIVVWFYEWNNRVSYESVGISYDKVRIFAYFCCVPAPATRTHAVSCASLRASGSTGASSRRHFPTWILSTSRSTWAPCTTVASSRWHKAPCSTFRTPFYSL